MIQRKTEMTFLVMELIIVFILSYGAIFIISELIKEYYGSYILISLNFCFISLIIGSIIGYYIYKLLKKNPDKKNDILVRLIQLFDIIILIIGFVVCIIVIILEFVIPDSIISYHIMLFTFLGSFNILTIIFFATLKRSPFIKEKETETTYGIPPKRVKRTIRQRVDLQNIKNFLDSYEELIKNDPNGVTDFIKNEMIENISIISGYYSKLNDKYKQKFNNISKFLDSK